jgi:ABC-type uncharacterized transport system substrate-binding protein
VKLPHRRQFLHVAAGAAALPVIVGANAQPMPALAYVAAKNANPKRLDVFKKGLAELGYVEGKDLRIEYREAVLDTEYNGVISDLLDRKIDIILAANVAATRAAARATKTIPVVMMAVFDPVGIGVVKSLERPGTNVTGTTMYAPQLIGERLQILKRLVPQLERVAMALNGQNPNNAAQFELLRSEARKLGIDADSSTFACPRMSTQHSKKRWPSRPRVSSTRLTPSSIQGDSRSPRVRRSTSYRSSTATWNTSWRED